jgi:hypothetical protein
MTTWRCAIVMLIATVALPTPADAIPPAICRQTMGGLFRAEDGRTMPVALRLGIRSDVGDLSIRGRFRCAAKRDRDRCFIDAAIVEAFGLSAGPGSRLAQSTSSFMLVRRDPPRVVCELTATTPFVRSLCVPALGGTFACRGDGEFGSVSGAFGLAVDSCRPCLSPRH